MNETETLYSILGVTDTASGAEIKKAYFDLVRIHRPEQSPQEFKCLKDAYDLLSNPRQRREYDQTLRYGSEVERLLEAAVEKIEEEPAQAARLCKQAIVLAPDKLEPRHLLINVLMGAKEYESAEAELRRLTKMLPQNASAFFQLSRCLWLQDNNAEAEIEGLHSLSLHHYDLETYRLLSWIYVDLGSAEKAIDILERAIQVDRKEDFQDVHTLLDILKICVAEQNEPAILRTTQRLYATIPEDDANRKDFLASSLYDLAGDYFQKQNYVCSHRLLRCIDQEQITDPELRESVEEMDCHAGACTDAVRMLKNEVMPESLKSYLYYSFFDEGDEITEAQRSSVLDTLLVEIERDPVTARTFLRYLEVTYPLFALEKAEFLKNLVQFADKVSLERPPLSPIPKLMPTEVRPATASAELADYRPAYTPSVARASAVQATGGGCLWPAIGIIATLCLLPLIIQLIVFLLPFLIGTAVIIAVVMYFLRKS